MGEIGVTFLRIMDTDKWFLVKYIQLKDLCGPPVQSQVCPLYLQPTHKNTTVAYQSIGCPNWMSVLTADCSLERKSEKTLSKLHPGEG